MNNSKGVFTSLIWYSIRTELNWTELNSACYPVQLNSFQFRLDEMRSEEMGDVNAPWCAVIRVLRIWTSRWHRTYRRERRDRRRRKNGYGSIRCSISSHCTVNCSHCSHLNVLHKHNSLGYSAWSCYNVKVRCRSWLAYLNHSRREMSWPTGTGKMAVNVLQLGSKSGYGSCRGVQRHPCQNKMRHRNPWGQK